MKTKAFGILLLACLGVCNARAGTFDCIWNFEDFTGGSFATRQVTIQPVAKYGLNTNTPAIIPGDLRSYRTTSSTSLTVSNLLNGRSYRVSFYGPLTPWGTNLVTVFTNSFDSDVTGYVNAADAEYLGAALVVDGASVAYSQAGADARFHNVSGDTSTNATFRGTLTMPATGVSNYVWTATNSTGAGFWAESSDGGITYNLANSTNLPQSGVTGLTDVVADVATKLGTNAGTAFDTTLITPLLDRAFHNGMLIISNGVGAQSGFVNYHTNAGLTIIRTSQGEPTYGVATLTLINPSTNDTGFGYGNEVHQYFKAGPGYINWNARKYIHFARSSTNSASGHVDEWVIGVNGAPTGGRIVFFDVEAGFHRGYFNKTNDPVFPGLTEFNSGGSAAVSFNQASDATSLGGTGGIEVWSGGTSSSKVGGITGAGQGHFAGTIYQTNLTAERVVVTSAAKGLASSSVTTTELGYLSGVTSALQTQLNAKQAADVDLDSAAGGITGIVKGAGNGGGYSAAAGTDIVGAFTGTPDGSKFLADDGTLKSVSGSADPNSITNNETRDIVLDGSTNHITGALGVAGAFTAGSATIDVVNTPSFNTGSMVVSNSLSVSNRVIASDHIGLYDAGTNRFGAVRDDGGELFTGWLADAAEDDETGTFYQAGISVVVINENGLTAALNGNGSGLTNIASTNIVGSTGVLAPTSNQTNYTVPLLLGSGNDMLHVYLANTNMFITFTGTNTTFGNRSLLLNALTNTTTANGNAVRVSFASAVKTNFNFNAWITNGQFKVLNFFNPDTAGTNVLASDAGFYRGGFTQ